MSKYIAIEIDNVWKCISLEEYDKRVDETAYIHYSKAVVKNYCDYKNEERKNEQIHTR